MTKLPTDPKISSKPRAVINWINELFPRINPKDALELEQVTKEIQTIIEMDSPAFEKKVREFCVLDAEPFTEYEVSVLKRYFSGKVKTLLKQLEKIES